MHQDFSANQRTAPTPEVEKGPCLVVLRPGETVGEAEYGHELSEPAIYVCPICNGKRDFPLRSEAGVVAPLYGRLKGYGKEKTATATQKITATLETWEEKVSLTLFAGGEFVVEVGEKFGQGEVGYRGRVHERKK